MPTNKPTPKTDSYKAHRNASGYTIAQNDIEFMQKLERDFQEALDMAREATDLFRQTQELAMQLRDSLIAKGKIAGLTSQRHALIAKAKEMLP